MWNQLSSYAKALPFHEITIPDQLRIIQKAGCMYTKHFKSATYIWDSMIFQHIVTNLKYFSTMHQINDDDLSLIKNDLLLFVDDLETLAFKGKHGETGNDVFIFISDLNFITNYGIIKSKNLCLTLFKIFLFNTTFSTDTEVFNETFAWMNSLQRTSTLISISGEKIRTDFFEKQRQIINTL
jgi:hypothetical protein